MRAIIILILGQWVGSILHWLEHHLLTCPFKHLTGLDCPGCGMQRSVIALLKGDVLASFKLYPATLPIIALVIFSAAHLRFEFKQGAFYIKFLYVTVALIIVSNYIYKIITNQLI